MYFTFKRLVLPLLVFGLVGETALAQSTALSTEEAERLQELTTEIETLNAELDELKAKADLDKEEVVKLWTGDIEFGYVDTSGNTEETTIKSRADVTRERDEWRYTIFYDSLNAKSSGDRTAEKYFLSNRLAYAFTEHNYAFGYASYDDDRFSGYDYQATASVGYGRRIYNLETFHWDAEIGPGYRYSKFDDTSTEDDTEEAIVRLFTKLDWNITDATNFTQSLSVEAGDDKTISKSITALKTQIIGAFSLKLSYTIKYTDEVPDDKKHADTETAVTLAYSF